ncbi:MAG: sugar phosphate isomerase/epimerase, partial [Bacteroidota bacterium]|nr:sugar phosphate isomerase/epimerase [Bacteroidota bacterium]
PRAIAGSLATLKDRNLNFVALGSSAQLHIGEPNLRKTQLDEGKRFVDLAHEIECPFVRVFPNKLDEGPVKSMALDLIISGMLELADYAEGSGVCVLLETHGDLLQTEDIVAVMQQVMSEQTGLLWDVTNVWSATGEDPGSLYPKIREFTRHLHIKDMEWVDGKIRYMRLGKGIVPLSSAIHSLLEGGYRGYFCFEWEKLWHEEIGDPAIAISEFTKILPGYIK